MANIRKKISELTALTSASLDTTLVGVDGGTTYKIELDTLADAVTSRVNILDRDRLSSLESVTSSFETKGRSVISSSAQITTLGFISSSTTIPTGTISSSAQITSFGFVSSSIDISSLNSFTSSQSSLNTAFTNGINARLQTSSFDTFSQSVDSRLIAATNEQSFNGLISGSSQFTSSYDARYVLSGSITQTTWDNIANKPNDIVSSSTQISDLGFVTGSYTTINSFNSLTQSFNSISQSFTTISGSVGGIDFSTLATTGSNTFIGNQTITGSVGIRANSGSWNFRTDGTLVLPNGTGIYGNGLLQVDTVGGFLLTSYTDQIGGGSQEWYFHSDGILNVPGNIEGADNLLTTSSFNSYTASQSTSSLVNRLNAIENVSGSWITESETGSLQTSITNLNTFTASISTASLVTSISNLNSATSSYLTSLSGAISSSSQLTSSFDTRYVASGSISAVPAGTISGSSQLTSSFDTRYVASGSISATPSGTISGSSQLTSSFDLRYLVTGSVTSSINALNTFTSSINSKTSSFATTGSNSFNGSQQITGSLVVSQNITGSASASFVSLAVNTTTPTQKVHLKGAVGIENGATMGITADQFVFGYAGSNLTHYTHKIQTGHDAQAALNRMDFLIANAASTWKTPLQLRHDRVIVSGSTYVSGDLIVTGSINGTINATNGVLSGSTQITPLLPAGTISGSSQLTSSYDSRYLTIGGDSVISGSSQLTSSYDGRYTQTGSFNTYTSSMNTWTSSLSAIGTLNVDYINAGRGASDQTSTGNGSDIIFNSSIVSSGISLNTSTGVFTLTAGKTYKLFAELSFSIFSSNVGFIIYDWVDATTNTRLDTSGVSAGIGEAINRDTNEFNATSTTLIYTPTTNQNVKVRIVDALGTATIRADIGTKAIIEQINPSVALNQFATLQVSGSLVVSGSTIFRGAVNFNNPVGSGASSEGGQINLGLATQNQTLTGSVIIDVYENKLRLFEEGGNNRGAYLNVASQSNSVGNSIVTSPNLLTMQTITSASYAALTPVSGTLYIIIG